MHHGMKQQTQRIYEDVALLALDLFARVVAMRIDAGPPFSALFTLWLSMIAAVGVASRSAFSRHRAVRRKVLRQIAPLATGTQDIHHPVHHRPHVGPALATAGLGPAELTVQHTPTRDP